MKLLKLTLVVIMSLGLTTVFATTAYASETVSSRSALNTSTAPLGAQPARTDVAGFVIASRGTLTATNAKGETRRLSRRSKFYANEILKTGGSSRAQLRFKDRALMTLRPKTELDIGDYHFGGQKDSTNQAIFNLLAGGFRTISGAIGRANKSAYRINTPAASIGIRGTDYELVISVDGKVFAAVHDGGISLANELGELDLGADSDYLFAEVSAGQSPLGLTEMPEIFKVENGKAQALSDEEKAKIAKKLAALQKNGQQLISDISVENEGDIQRIFDDEKFIENIDRRISPELLTRLKNSNNLTVAINGESGDTLQGKSLEVKGGMIFLTDDNVLLAVPDSNSIDRINPGEHKNVTWGRWNKEFVINGGDNLETILTNSINAAETEDKYFMSANLLDAQSIVSRQDTVTLQGFTVRGGTTGDILAIDETGSSGQIELNFAAQTVNGSMNVALIDNRAAGTSVSVGAVSINFDGDMLNAANTQQNTNYNGMASIAGGDGDILTNTEDASDLIQANVTGGVVDPGDDGDAFAGAFNVSLPAGVDINLFGQFLFSNGFSVDGRNYSYSLVPLSKPPFLKY